MALSTDFELDRVSLRVAAVAVCLISYLVFTYFTNGLHRYPGPILAKFSNLWHYLDVRSNHHHDHLIELHRRYGDVVRIGPNRLSIACPEYVGRIYSTHDAYPKVSNRFLEPQLSANLLKQHRVKCMMRFVFATTDEGRP